MAGLTALALTVTGFAAGAAPALGEPATASAEKPTEIAPKPVTPEVPVDQGGSPIGAITEVVQDGTTVNLRAENGVVRVSVLDDLTLRVEADPSGSFSDPANTPQDDPARTADIVVGTQEFSGSAPTVEDGETITITTGAVALSIDRATSRMTLTRADGSVVWEETSPITFGTNSATQHLSPLSNEQFLGGGMQNGRSIHTGATINIARSFDWDDDGYPNAVPYYMTSAGYGVLRNTFAPGTYAFTEDATTTHRERRFDAYYFVGDYKEALDGYTQLTGRPHMPPIYALEYGDADCYNRSSETYKARNPNSWNVPGKLTTPDAVDIARGFVDHDMPGGWMLVNDGYGCEYVELPETVSQIEEETGLKTGLWTERSLQDQEFEVGEAGIRLRKLDVAWVGAGYRLALTGCEAAHDGIEANSNARGTSLMVEGWAGSQRCGMQWTGDHSGNLDAIRWQVPALLSSGNSGQAFTTGDVDGIFGGSPESYVRDLQWKAFAPALYSMSGWAQVDKRPWLYGEEATEINRKYLQLRQRLMPYIYTLAAESHASGTPMMRSLALEYPDDPYAYSAEANSEFLLGEDFLVAPVFTDSDVRNGIYLPEGQWVDYWTGDLYDGGRIVDGYTAPLETLPVFVRAGAVVPQGPTARNASLVPEDSMLTLDVYPQGESSFELYEDDKVTRAHSEGAESRQDLTVTAPEQDGGDVVVTIGERSGDYDGKSESRPYALDVHTGTSPENVDRDGTQLDEHASIDAFNDAETGWFFDADAKGGVVKIKTGSVGSAAAATVTLSGTSAVGGEDSDAHRAYASVALPDRVFQGEETTADIIFHNTGTKAKTGIEISPELPEGWSVVDAEGLTAETVEPGTTHSATIVLKPGSGSAAGTQSIGATVTYQDASGGTNTLSGSGSIDVAFADIAAAFNHVSITSVATKEAGNFDGGGASFSEDALAAAGAEWGQPLMVERGEDTLEFTWPEAGPGEANSVSPEGQTVALSGQGTHLAFLGSSATGAGVNPEVTITYQDGTSTNESVYFPNWLIQSAGPLKDANVAVASKGRNSASNPEGYEYPTYTYQVYANVVPLNPVKELRSITFGTGTTAKFFDVKPVNLALPDVPVGDSWVSDLEWTAATNGWGEIGIDVANKDSASSPDKPLVINTTTELKKTYEKGLGVHADSRVTYFLGGQCTRFTVDTGLEDGFTGSVVFSVDVDDTTRYQGTTFQAGFPTEVVDLDVTGAQYIDLIVTAPGSKNGAHGIWGDARLECAGSEPEFAADVDVKPKTIAGTVYLAVRVKNTADEAVDINVDTPYGAKSFVDVQPGKSAYQAFNTRKSATEAGQVDVGISSEGVPEVVKSFAYEAHE